MTIKSEFSIYYINGYSEYYSLSGVKETVMAKRDTRKKILNAAEELFSKNGFDGVPTRVLASKAGITEMTLFNHFGSKELLYKTVVKERFLDAEVDSVFSELTFDDLEQDLKRISGKLFENFLANMNVMMMRLKEKQSFQNDDVFRLEKDPILKSIIPVFQSYAEKGLVCESAGSGAMLFIAAIKGLFLVCLMENRTNEDIRDRISLYISTFCYGVVCK